LKARNIGYVDETGVSCDALKTPAEKSGKRVGTISDTERKIIARE
jgi:hypothetical protein